MKVVALIVALALVSAGIVVGCSRDSEAKKQEFLANGNLYYESQQYATAVIAYRNALQIDRRFGPARLGLARTYERMGETARALAEYTQAADLLPEDTAVQLTAAEYLLAAGRLDEGKAYAERVLQRDARNARALVILGNAFAGLREPDKAIEQIEEALRIDPFKAAAHASLGMLRLKQGQIDAAEKAFRSTVEYEPRWVPGHLALANHYWATGRLTEAERSLRTALDLEPSNPLTHQTMVLFYVTTGRAAQAEPHVKALMTSGAEAFALADFYLLQGRAREAITELQRMHANPNHATDADRRLAYAYGLERDFTNAHRVISGLLQKDPKDAATLLLKGQLLWQEDKRKEAIAQFEAAADVDPNAPGLQFALGRSHAARGDFDAARRAFNEVLRLNPRAAEAQIELARLDLAEGRVGGSVQLASDAVRSEPGNLEAQLTLVRSLLAAKDVSGARKVLDPLMRAHPDAAPLHVQLALASAASNDPAGARRSFARALELEPDSLEAIGGWTALDLDTNQPNAARSRIDAAVARNPNNAELWLLAGRTYAACRDFAATERALRRALTLEPDLLPGYTLLGQLYLLQGRLPEARREFETVSRREAKPIASVTMLGMFALLEGDVPGAEKHFERVLDLEARAPIAANNLAWLYADRGEKLDRALELAQLAAEQLPRSAEVRDTLGWVHYKRRAADRAIASFREAIALDGDEPSYHYHLGLAYALAENPGEARESLQRALNLGGATQPWAAEARLALRSISSSLPAR
jgi:tetratricopeptide (TPR) repeat protein